jgi:hypothetical protein
MHRQTSSPAARADTQHGGRQWVAVCLIACAAAFGLGPHLAAPHLAASSPSQTPPAVPSPPARSRVRLEVLSTRWDRPTGTPHGETRVVLEPGQRATQYVVAGDLDDPDFCRPGFVSDPAGLRPVYLWEVQLHLVAVTSMRTTMELRWSRSSPREPEVPLVGDVRTVTLGPGDYHVFDYVAASNGSSPCASVLLRVLADPVQDPAPQPPVAIDVWMAQDDARGRHWARQRLAGLPGQALPFQLGPLEWSLDGAPRPHGADDTPIRLNVSGTVRPVVRADGRLDVAVEMTRGYSLGGARVTGEGRTAFDCAFDEAVEIPLPEAKGQSQARVAGRAGSPAAPGVREDGQRTVVDFAEFFAGKPTSLYIVVHRQR